MHTKTRRPGRRGRLSLGLALAAALVASLSIGASAASATCLPPKKKTVVLTPPTQTHVIGQQATVTATAKCDGVPLARHNVRFRVTSGPNYINATNKVVLTDANGIAKWTYTSTKTGTDTVGAKLDEIWTCCVKVIWTAPRPPLRYTGYAHNASISATLTVLGIVQTVTLPPLNPAGPVDSTVPTTITKPLASTSGLIDASVLETNVTTGAGASSAYAKVDTVKINPLLTVVTPLIDTTEVLAESKATCSAKTGKTTIAYLKIGGTVVVGPGGLVDGSNIPANFTLLNIAGVKVVLNEQVVTPTKISVNAIHITVGALNLTGADVIVSHAESDIHNC